jgi:anti-sigma factor RsiW
MSNEPCSVYSELLVDYADGELTAADHDRVAEHLATCAKCQAELRRLQRSLELARAAWQDAALPLPATSQTAVAACERARLGRIVVACGAAAAILLLAFTLWRLPRRSPDGQPASVIAQQEAIQQPKWSKEEIDSYISRQTRTARLAVAVQLLASQPGLEEYKIQAERYLAKVSGDAAHGP